jgi:hypothetical protein
MWLRQHRCQLLYFDNVVEPHHHHGLTQGMTHPGTAKPPLPSLPSPDHTKSAFYVYAHRVKQVQCLLYYLRLLRGTEEREE